MRQFLFVSKKRPREESEGGGGDFVMASKTEPDYWRNRLFKSTYIYKGRRRRVRHWSVKIQHQAARKTIALRSRDPLQAATEACALYQSIVKHGWSKAIDGSLGRAGFGNLRTGEGILEAERRQVEYWEQRLIKRGYTMDPRSKALPELSVRMEHAGTSHYVPLGTADRQAAARRALELYYVVAREGWDAFNLRHRMELTLAFRWLDSPLAWTYTTIHTQSAGPEKSVAGGAGSGGEFPVAVVETDAGIRNALELCLARMEGFRCSGSFANPQQALFEVMRKPPRLILVNHSFAEKSGAILLGELKAAVPQVAGLLYSVYDDSEELFKATPGGAGMYLLQRSAPTQFLEPIVNLLKRGVSSSADMTPGVWEYFRERVARLPIGSAARPLANLTQREHEVLALLSRGHADKDIADRLTISIYTVHEHVRNIFEKLGVHNRTEAVVKFLQK